MSLPLRAHLFALGPAYGGPPAPWTSGRSCVLVTCRSKVPAEHEPVAGGLRHARRRIGVAEHTHILESL